MMLAVEATLHCSAALESLKALYLSPLVLHPVFVSEAFTTGGFKLPPAGGSQRAGKGAMIARPAFRVPSGSKWPSE